MVNCKIVNNPIIRNAMQSDTERLTWTWLITFADGFGRQYADPKIIRGLLFSGREPEERPTWSDIETYFDRWEENGLIIRYEVEGQRYYYYPRWRENQPGLRQKERPVIPPPPGVNDQTYPTDWYDPEQAAIPYDPEAPHMRIAIEWYKGFSRVTAKLVRPGPTDYLAAKAVFDRCEIEDVMKAIDYYFTPGLENWWVKDKRGRQNYNFKGFCTNIATIMADMSKPQPKVKTVKEYRRQCVCGKIIVLTKTVNFDKCECGRRWELVRGSVMPSEENDIDTDQSGTADSADQF
jgi:hypothetical protein